ncbi:MAG: alpha/beta hydrolase [Myxococcales bacterium]|nr:alpha/beta hydrolase [Myxococcales bacterium]
MITTTDRHAAPDGTPLHVYCWKPSDIAAPLRAVVHITHGMAEHAGRYARLAEALTDARMLVYAHDQRGHGKTARAGELGHLEWAELVSDLDDLIRVESERHPGVPFVAFAHSMGSYVLQELIAKVSGRVAAMVLSGSNGKPPPLAKAGRLVARAERLRVGARGTSKLLTSLSFDAFNKAFRPNRTAFDWLSRDPAEVDAYVEDPLCGFDCSTTTWVGLLDALDRIAAPEHQARIRKDLPVYIFAGSEDMASNRTKGLEQLLGAYRAAGLTDVTHRFYPGARHETLNETNRDEVTRDLIAWLDRKLPAQPDQT